MHPFHRIFLRAAAGLLAGVALSATAQPRPDMLRIRVNADIRSTDPGVNRDGNSDSVVSHMVEGLVALKEDTSVGPMLAQSVTTSADGRTYTFVLRPGVKFSNGQPLTSADVLFAWNRYMRPETGWRCTSELDGRGLTRVLSVKATGPLTVVFELAKPSPLFLTTLARSDCGQTGIFHRSSLGPDGKWLQPVGTGPFKLSEWKRGQYIELARNEFYSALPGKVDGYTGNKSPLVAKVRFVVIPDNSSAKAALLTGAVDLVYDVDEADLPDYEKRKDLVLAVAPTMDLTGILLQTRDPLLKDPRIRRAIALTLDVPEMVEVITNGRSPASRSAIPPASPYYGPAQRPIGKRDVAAARKLLAEAGYRGQHIKMLTTKRFENVYTVAVLTQALAQEAGLNIDVTVLDWATLLDHYMRGDYQMTAYSFSARLDPSLSYEMFTGPKDREPRKVWDDPEAIALVAQSTDTVDKAQRQALIDRLDVKLRQDVPAIWLYSKVRTGAYRSYVKGYVGWPVGQPRAWGVSLSGD